MKIELTDVTIKRLGETLINNLSTVLENRKLTGILGSNEHACSYLLKTIAGIIAPTEGTVKIDDVDLYLESPRSEQLRKNNSYIFRAGGLISNITIRENLFLPLIYQFPDSTEEQKLEIIKKYFAIFGIDEMLLSKRPVNITEMQQKLIIIIRALITEPDLLFIDNPFVNLNRKNQQLLFEFVEEFLNSGDRHIIYTSGNYIPFIAKSDYLLVFNEVELIGQGTVENFRTENPEELDKLLTEYYNIAI